MGQWGTGFLVAAAISVSVLALSTPVAAASSFTGNVIGVSDGDTITVLKDRSPVKIRLDGVDCLEAAGQTIHCGDGVGKTVTVDGRDVDRYGRLIARVSVGGQDLSLALVKAGFA